MRAEAASSWRVLPASNLARCPIWLHATRWPSTSIGMASTSSTEPALHDAAQASASRHTNARRREDRRSRSGCVPDAAGSVPRAALHGDSLPPAFGAVVRRRRVAAGLSQEALAAATALTAVYVSRVEAGKNTPTIDVARSLAAVLGCGWELVREAEGDRLTSDQQ